MVPPCLVLPRFNYTSAVTDVHHTALQNPNQNCRDHKCRWKIVSALTHLHYKQMKNVKGEGNEVRSPFNWVKSRQSGTTKWRDFCGHLGRAVAKPRTQFLLCYFSIVQREYSWSPPLDPEVAFSHGDFALHCIPSLE